MTHQSHPYLSSQNLIYYQFYFITLNTILFPSICQTRLSRFARPSTSRLSKKIPSYYRVLVNRASMFENQVIKRVLTDQYFSQFGSNRTKRIDLKINKKNLTEELWYIV